MNRSILLAAVASVLLSACDIVQPDTAADLSLMQGREVAVVQNRPTSLRRGVPGAQTQGQTSLAAAAFVAVFNVTQLATSRIGSIPEPTVDPIALTEQSVGAALVAQSGSRLRTLRSPTTTSAQQRSEAIGAARGVGFSGLLVDMESVRYDILANGKVMGLGTERFTLNMVGTLAVIDTLTGETAGRARCTVSEPLPETASTRGITVGEVDALVTGLAERCASAMTATLLPS
ncbi:hypothetical protein [Pontivivens ytuae]|uniref:Lipoprotein n=1 Tax=Pontivivens ytuae TaxID=2789856 RepID=A0A7S9LRN8_9RHOB|nr:hypothetical protein [Pontivivens ytuae]QPH53982.1 hypothetical protein I0K15_19785 [Pontivivens ytuae]